MTTSDAAARLNQALEGRYQIDRELGEGGMATVYLADDLKHERKVALKVLKPELAAVVGAERFLAEIKTTANLTHPHILPLFDSGEADGFLFYVMPYVEGESLRERLDREHQLPVDEAVKITTDLAEALDYAHRHKIIHRDIKPANILMHEGRPLIADFGIALAIGAAGGGRLTETGLSLGTPFYMSPEQATGEQFVGSATDTYALGVVLYEMLTGDPPYMGSTAQAVLGQIIAGEAVSATKKRASVPANVDAAIRKALEKLPADRFTSAQELARALTDRGFRSTEPDERTAGVASVNWRRAALGSTAMALGFASAFAWSLTRTDSNSTGRFSINLPDSVPMAYIGSASLGNGRRALAISRDGAMLVYVGNRGGVNRLYTRPINSYEIDVLPRTEGAYNPFFSPDGRWVGFFVGNEVRKVSLDGQDPVPLGTVINPMGADWGLDDQIVVGNEGGTLTQISAEGGSTTILRDRRLLGGGFLYPQILPASTGILTTDWLGARVSDVATGEDYPIRDFVTNSRYVDSGHLIWSQLSTLFAARFDLRGRRIAGQVVPILSGVRTEIYGVSQWDASDNGMLVYAAGAAVSTLALTWVTGGGPEPLPFEGTAHGTFELSPDETRLVPEQA